MLHGRGEFAVDRRLPGFPHAVGRRGTRGGAMLERTGSAGDLALVFVRDRAAGSVDRERSIRRFHRFLAWDAHALSSGVHRNAMQS